MKRKIALFTLALMIFQIIYFGLYSSNAKAAPQPPTPDQSVSIKFSSIDRQKITITSNNIGWEFANGGKFAMSELRDQTIHDNENVKNVADDSFKFSLTNPQSTCRRTVSSGNSAIPSTTTEDPIYLLIARAGNEEKYKVLGLFYSNDSSKYVYAKSGTTDCKFTGDLADQVAKLAATLNGPSQYAVVDWGVSQGDTNAICVDLGKDWTSMEDGMRAIMVGNDYWTKSESTGNQKMLKLGQFISISPVAGVAYVAGLRILSSFATGQQWIDNRFPTDIDYSLTPAGEAVFSTVITNAQAIQDKISLLSQNNDPSKWPCSNKLTKMKYEKSLESLPGAATYSSLNELSKDVNELVTKFKDLVANKDQPVTSAEKDMCSSNGNNTIVGMLNEAMCGFTILIKSWADAIFNWAVGLMTQMIGLAQNESANISDTTGSTASTSTPISDAMKQQATNFCKAEKAKNRSDWSTGPCLTKDLNSSGYALDVVHDPRQPVDNNVKNTCEGMVKWIEVNVDNCQFIRQSN